MLPNSSLLSPELLPRTCCSLNLPGIEPDTVVRVGKGNRQHEFHEHSPILACASDYFAAAFRSGMKESREKQFSFPDMQPLDWVFFMQLISPMSTVKQTQDNIAMVLKLYHDFCLRNLPPAFDKEYRHYLQQHELFAPIVFVQESENSKDYYSSKYVANLERCYQNFPLMDTLALTLKAKLSLSTEFLWSVMDDVFKVVPGAITLKNVEKLLSCYGEYEDNVHKAHVESYVPADLLKSSSSSNDDNDGDKRPNESSGIPACWLENPLFPRLVKSEMEKNHIEFHYKQLYRY